jgi:hypothetical protein
MLMEKYVRQRQEWAHAHIRKGKRPRSPYYDKKGWLRCEQRAMARQGTEGMQTQPRIMVKDDGPSQKCAKGSRRVLNGEPLEGKHDDEIVMVRSVPCKLQSEIYLGNQ